MEPEVILLPAKVSEDIFKLPSIQKYRFLICDQSLIDDWAQKYSQW